MYKLLTVAVFLLTLIFQSCEEDGQIILPESNGGKGQLLIVSSTKLIKGAVGDTIRSVFKEEFPALPQIEPRFSVSEISMSNFTSIFKRNLNILIVKISKNIKKSGVNVSHNLWAKPQIVITIIAKSEKEFIDFFSKKGETIAQIFEKTERNRYISLYKKSLNKKAMKALEKHHNIKMIIPKHYKLDMDSSNFVWMSNETNKLTQAILVWDYPYKDTSDLSLKNLILKRDSITLNNVRGPKENAYMSTEKRRKFFYNKITVDKRYTVQIRGLWTVVNGFMGGPFVSYTTIDKKRNRVVTVDVFVYAGSQDKRGFIQQVDAIPYTLKFTD